MRVFEREKIRDILLLSALMLFVSTLLVISLRPDAYYAEDLFGFYMDNMDTFGELSGREMYVEFDLPKVGGVDALMRAQDFINGNIAYTTEDVEYWQTPMETLQRGTGDCEDMAFLFMSLAVSYGYGKEDIFVAMGMYGEGGHAWVVVRQEGQEFILEPTISVPTFIKSEQLYYLIYRYNAEDGYKETRRYAWGGT